MGNLQKDSLKILLSRDRNRSNLGFLPNKLRGRLRLRIRCIFCDSLQLRLSELVSGDEPIVLPPLLVWANSNTKPSRRAVFFWVVWTRRCETHISTARGLALFIVPQALKGQGGRDDDAFVVHAEIDRPALFWFLSMYPYGTWQSHRRKSHLSRWFFEDHRRYNFSPRKSPISWTRIWRLVVQLGQDRRRQTTIASRPTLHRYLPKQPWPAITGLVALVSPRPRKQTESLV